MVRFLSAGKDLDSVFATVGPFEIMEVFKPKGDITVLIVSNYITAVFGKTNKWII